MTDGGVLVASDIASKGGCTDGRVILTGIVISKCASARSRVVAPSGVSEESSTTTRRVACTICVVRECLVAKSTVAEAIGGIVGKSLKADSRAETELLKTRRPSSKTVERLITHSRVGTGKR